MLMSEDTMVQFIHDDLDASIINIEISDDIIKRNLTRAVMLSSDYFNYSTYKTVVPTKSDGSSGWLYLSELEDDDADDGSVPTIIAVYPTVNVLNLDAALLGLGSVFISTTSALNPQLNAYSNMLHKLTQLESILGRNARVIGDKLHIAHYFSSVTVEFIPQQVKIENIHEGDWIRFLVDYTVALCKRQMGQLRGKYVVDSNPAATNAETLITQANETMTTLMEDLKNKGLLLASR